jgi:2-isopropylmalate synthase
VEIPVNYPIVGRDAFRTATGVHAAAVIKAAKTGDTWLEDLVYSAVPASMVGRQQIIEVGPMSGMANVAWWLTHHGYDVKAEVVDAIFAAAKRSKAVLDDEQIHRIARDAGAIPPA